MNTQRIEQLLHRYWEAETTVDEERQLRQFFNSNDVPQHLMRYKDLFDYEEFLQNEHLDSDLGYFKGILGQPFNSPKLNNSYNVRPIEWTSSDPEVATVDGQ